jgi:uncharacterized protein (DUF1697 family)
VAFATRAGAVSALERRLAQEIEKGIGRAFGLTLRSVDQLRRLVDDDPFDEFPVAAGARRVVSFLSEGREAPVTLPIDADGVRIHGRTFRTRGGPVFMTLLEKAFGKSITTRTWETVRKCAAA